MKIDVEVVADEVTKPLLYINEDYKNSLYSDLKLNICLYIGEGGLYKGFNVPQVYSDWKNDKLTDEYVDCLYLMYDSTQAYQKEIKIQNKELKGLSNNNK